MKLYSVLPVVICLLSVNAAGQKPNLQTPKNSNAVKASVSHIDSVVKKILADTSIIYTTAETEKEKGNNNYIIRAGYKKDRLAILEKITSTSFFTGCIQVFYFDSGEPVLYTQQYTNGSRMGSCGQVSVSFYHYLKDSVAFAGIAKSLTSHYTCYHYSLQKPSKKTLTDETDKLKTILKTRTATLKTPKKSLPFISFVSLNSYQWPTQESYGF